MIMMKMTIIMMMMLMKMMMIVIISKADRQTNKFWPFIAASFWNSSSNDSFSAPSLAKLLSNSRSSVGSAKATKQSQNNFILETKHPQEQREWTVTSHNNFHLGFLSVGNSEDVRYFGCMLDPLFSDIMFLTNPNAPYLAVHRPLISL